MSYLGQLEILLPLSMKYGLIDDEELQNQYGYRIICLTNNRAVINHINDNSESYRSILQLIARFANF